MRRPRRILGWIVGLLILLPLLAAGGVALAADTEPGQGFIATQLSKLTGGKVEVYGLSGSFPSELRAAKVELRDNDGPWLTIENLVLDLHPLSLVTKTLNLGRATASLVSVARLPASESTASTPSSSSSSYSLPVKIEIDQLRIAKLDLARPVAGEAASFFANGSLHLVSLEQGDVQLALRRLDADGAYDLNGKLDPAQVQAALTVKESAHGSVGSLAALPDLGPLSVDATLDGPRDAIATKLAVDAGQLTARANGTVDLVHSAADLSVQANAPAMSPRPDLSWQSIALDARVQGPFNTVQANGTLAIAALHAAGAAIQSIDAKVQGNAGQVGMHAEANGIQLPGPKPDALAAAPLVVDATVGLDAPTRPLTLSIKHPLVIAEGTAETGGALQAHSNVELPDLGPLAAIAGYDVQGHTKLTLTASQTGETIAFAASGPLAITGGMAPLPGLIGEEGTLALAGTETSSTVTVSKFTLDGKTLALAADGNLKSRVADVNLHTKLQDLAVLSPTLAGHVGVDAHVAGPLDDFGMTADVAGEVASPGVPSGSLTAHLEAQHLPKAPDGTLTARGTLDASALDLAVNVKQEAAGMRVDIGRADWKSAHASGALTLPQGATVPLGKLDLRMTHLADLRALTGKPLTGSFTASLETTERAGKQTATLKADAHDAGIAGTATIGRATLDAAVADPTTKPVVQAKLTADGIALSGMQAHARIDIAGPEDALGVKLAAGLRDFRGGDLDVTSKATVDVPGKATTLAALQAGWKGETLRLLAPAHIRYSPDVAVDRLLLGVRQATIDVAGRVSPTLDLTASIRDVTPELAKIAMPDLSAEGTLRADARLTGTPSRPVGTVRVAAGGLRMTGGATGGLPPASVIANVDLHGDSAQIDTRLNAGRDVSLTVTGRAPIPPSSGSLDLRTQGTLDLAFVNPILEVNGRHVRGRMTLDARIAGTMSAPQISGTARLARGEVQDYGVGARIQDINALIEADGTTIRIARFTGQAGKGTLGLTGTISPAAPGMPVDLHLVARDAEPLRSDLLTATISADLTVRGEIKNQLAATGGVTISHAEIRIPEHLPASVAVLDVRRPGEKPPPPPSPDPRSRSTSRCARPARSSCAAAGWSRSSAARST